MPHLDLSEELVRNASTSQTQEEIYDCNFHGPGSFGIRVNKGGKKSFFLIYPLNGRRRRITLGSYPVLSLADARKQAIELLKETAKGKDPAAAKKKYGRHVNFEQLCLRFLREHASKQCSNNTYREYERIISRELIPLWGRMLPGAISAQDVLRLISEISLTRGSPVMANRVRVLVSKIFNFGIALRVTEQNPVKSTKAVSVSTEGRSFLSIQETRKLLESLRHEGQIFSSVFKLILLTGQRPNQVMSMKWGDLHLDYWIVSGSSDLPAHTQHKIYLVPQAQEVLRKLQRRYSGSSYVFANNRGSHLRYARKAAQELSRSNELGFSFSPQVLRNTVENGLLQIGVRPELVQRILNRKTAIRYRSRANRNTNSNFDYYPEMQQALARWSRTLFPTNKKGTTPISGGAKVIPLFGDLE